MVRALGFKFVVRGSIPGSGTELFLWCLTGFCGETRDVRPGRPLADVWLVRGGLLHPVSQVADLPPSLG